eukprot:m.357730 g.357730  ORF g.357730 m.357730 type:complete len:185 (-) comp17912_c0_seq1:1979-2533(-)
MDSFELLSHCDLVDMLVNHGLEVDETWSHEDCLKVAWQHVQPKPQRAPRTTTARRRRGQVKEVAQTESVSLDSGPSIQANTLALKSIQLVETARGHSTVLQPVKPIQSIKAIQPIQPKGSQSTATTGKRTHASFGNKPQKQGNGRVVTIVPFQPMAHRQETRSGHGGKRVVRQQNTAPKKHKKW